MQDEATILNKKNKLNTSSFPSLKLKAYVNLAFLQRPLWDLHVRCHIGILFTIPRFFRQFVYVCGISRSNGGREIIFAVIKVKANGEGNIIKSFA